jgi:hypothetical protein
MECRKRYCSSKLNPSLRTAHTVGPRIIEVTRNPWNALGSSKLNLPFWIAHTVRPQKSILSRSQGNGSRYEFRNCIDESTVKLPSWIRTGSIVVQKTTGLVSNVTLQRYTTQHAQMTGKGKECEERSSFKASLHVLHLKMSRVWVSLQSTRRIVTWNPVPFLHSSLQHRESWDWYTLMLYNPASVFPTNFHLSSMWHQWKKKCSTFVQILDGIITNWWKFAQMDEKWSNWMNFWQ